MEGRFSEATASVIARAQDEARGVGSGTVGTEHLLLGLLGGGPNRATKALLDAGATLDGCRSKVVELAGDPGGTPRGSQLELSDRARRTLERADRLALRLRAPHVDPEHVLVSLLDVEGRAGQVLRGFGVDVAMLRKAASADATNEPRPTPQAEQVAPVPRCTRCGADLSDDRIGHRVVRSKSTEDESRKFVIVFCSECGTPVGVAPVPVKGR